MEIVKKFSNGSVAVKCAFCEGSGNFPETPFTEDNFETNPCDVCEGSGFNIFLTDEGFIVPCKCCNEEGKSYDESGYFVGNHCPVCNGRGYQNVSNKVMADFDEQFWSLINTRIVDVSKKRFDSGHYADSIEASLKEINSVIKKIVLNKINKEYDGASLMEKALSLNDPIIVLDDLSIEDGKNVQKGFMQIFSGAMTGIRNPKAHSNININKEQAIHYLFLASILMNKIDNSLT